ncbi:MAG TPA: hypothetical protein VFO60_04685 [Candidatus Dormibacteraeota bacterium]|nr:hypothetical protein [Candidatus Dormibacteraeota bacterium]
MQQPAPGFDALRQHLLTGLSSYAQGIAESVLLEWGEAVQAVPQLGRAASTELVSLLALEPVAREEALRARWKRQRDGDAARVRASTAHLHEWRARVALDATRAEEAAIQAAAAAAEAAAAARARARSERFARFERDAARADELALHAVRVAADSRRADELAAGYALLAARAMRAQAARTEEAPAAEDGVDDPPDAAGHAAAGSRSGGAAA